MRLRDQVTPQKGTQCLGVQPIRLDLRVGNDPSFAWVGEDHPINRVNLLKNVVQPGPVPAGFYDHAVRLRQRTEVRRKRFRRIINAGFLYPRTRSVRRVRHRIPFMEVDSCVKHKGRLRVVGAVDPPSCYLWSTRGKLVLCRVRSALFQLRNLSILYGQ